MEHTILIAGHHATEACYHISYHKCFNEKILCLFHVTGGDKPWEPLEMVFESKNNKTKRGFIIIVLCHNIKTVQLENVGERDKNMQRQLHIILWSPQCTGIFVLTDETSELLLYCY